MARSLKREFTIDDQPVNKVVRFEEEHRLGLPPRLHITVTLVTYVPTDVMLGQSCVLSVGFEDAEHQFKGLVEEVSLNASSLGEDATYVYELTVVPLLAVLARHVDCRIFQEQTVQEICDELFAELGVTRVEWSLSGSYPVRTYCVQYQESTLAFISRLLEDEGIYFSVEARDDGDTVVLSDDSPMLALPIDGDAVLPARTRSDLAMDADFCLIPSEQHRVRAGTFVLRDFNFETPNLDMTATFEGDADTDLEVYDYPGEYTEPSEGKRRAQVRYEEEEAWRRTMIIEAVCPRVAAGRKLEISDAGDLNGEYFVVSAVHHFADEDHGQGSATAYHVLAELIPLEVPYRPRRRTPKPIIHGPQTARVVAPAGAEPEAIHTDEHGRVKVKFPWCRSEHDDDKASCWMRVAQLQSSGSLVLPRIQWEVIVEFLEGNPDRPVITGRLYNGTFMPPYALPDGKSRTSLMSRSTPGGEGSNEIRFEDKAGSEELMVRAQHDMTVATANNKETTVGNNESTTIGVDSSLSVGGNQDVKITMGSQNTIGADQSVTVGGNRKVEVNAVAGMTVHGAASTTVGGDQFEMDGNPLEALLALAAREVQEFLQEQADRAVQAVTAQVQGAVDQALGPIQDLTSQVEGLGNNMQAIADGDLGAIGGLVGDASGLPGAGDFARSMGGDDGPSGGGPLSDAVDGGNLVTSVANNAIASGSAAASSAANSAIASGVGAAHSAIADAMGFDGAGGGGQSQQNMAGPDGEVGGQDDTDRTKGPGHSIAVVAGTHKESVGGLKGVAALDGINLNVSGNMTQSAGAAHIEVVIGNRAESTESDKDETALGLVVLSKGGESETVGGDRMTMVGGAIVDRLKGSHAIQAGGMASFIGAFHKYEASGTITLKCGESEVVIDGGGVTIKSPLVAKLASKIQLTKKVNEI